MAGILMNGPLGWVDWQDPDTPDEIGSALSIGGESVVAAALPLVGKRVSALWMTSEVPITGDRLIDSAIMRESGECFADMGMGAISEVTPDLELKEDLCVGGHDLHRLLERKISWRYRPYALLVIQETPIDLGEVAERIGEGTPEAVPVKPAPLVTVTRKMDTSAPRTKPLIESFVNGLPHPFTKMEVSSNHDLYRREHPEEPWSEEIRSLGVDHFLTLGDKKEPLPHVPELSRLRSERIITADEFGWEERGVMDYSQGGFPFYHLNRWRRKECRGYLLIGLRWSGKEKDRSFRCGRAILFPCHAVAVERLFLPMGRDFVTWEEPRTEGRHARKLSRSRGGGYVAAAFSVVKEARVALEITDRITFSTPISCHFDYPEEFWETEIWLAYAYKPGEEELKRKWDERAGVRSPELCGPVAEGFVPG